MDSDLYEAALECVESGISIVPVDWKTKKPMILRWKHFQDRRADSGEVVEWFRRMNPQAIGVVCGRVSGGLVVMDFDNPVFFDLWEERVGDISGFSISRSGGGGRHVFFRCPAPGGNQKLAWATGSGRREIAIETRGEGGYVVIPPSFHPSGTRYEWQKGGVREIPRLTQEESDRVLSVARGLDEFRKTLERFLISERKTFHQVSRGRVIGAFCRAHTLEEMLERYGYERRSGNRYARPGGESDSVTILHGRSFHHSSSDPLSDGFWHNAFDLFALYEFGGNVKKAVKAAAGELGMKLSGVPAPSDGDIPRGSG